ncbi:MAG TPA: hypothetical protein VJ991_11160 [Balneolales bacterium]|nr:hypothetical protein [Balneolales bacterium]
MSEQKTIKEQLLQESEKLVDLSEALEGAIEQNNQEAADKIIHELDAMGSKLVQQLEEVEGDDLAYVNFMLGSLCSVLRMWPQAEDSYYKALDQWPDHVGILNELFLSLYAQEKYEAAEDIIKKSIEHGGETPDVLQNYAAVLVKRDHLAEAKVVLFNSMAKFPDDQETREMLGELDKMT